MTSDNPFLCRGPIDDPNAFFDRVEPLQRCFDLLESPARGVWVEVTGPHRIGKSSLLRALKRRAAAERPGWAVGCVSLQGVVDDRMLWQQIGAALQARGATPCPSDVAARLAELDGRQGRAVLLLDEAPAVVQAGFRPDVFDLLRGWTETYPLALVTAAPRRLHTFAESAFGGVSPAWSNAVEVRLDAFYRSEAADYLAVHTAGRRFAFRTEEAQDLVALTGGHPWRLAVAAFHCYEAKAAGAAAAVDWQADYRRELAAEPREARAAQSPQQADRIPTYDPGGSAEIRVFVSSPMKGLNAERTAVAQACRDLDLVPVIAEDFGARDGSSREVCLGELRRCQIVLLLMPDRYGPPTEAGISATQEEWLEAERLRLPRLAFVQAATGRPASWWRRLVWPGRNGAQADGRQAAWIEAVVGRFGNGLAAAEYDTPASLGDAVRRDLGRLVRRYARWGIEAQRR